MGLEWLELSWALVVAVAAGSAVAAAGLWVVATRVVQLLEARRARRRQRAARHVHPYLFAAEDLQARLYDILQGAPSNPRLFAEETAYLIAQYFGWERASLRHGPHARDRKTVRLARAVREAFATEALGPAMRFSRSEQGVIADLMLTRVQGHAGTELATISLLEFVDAMEGTGPASGAAARPAGLARVRSLGTALDALRAATSPATVPAPQRLARVQARLVALVTHLERKERLSLFDGARPIALEEKHAAAATAWACEHEVVRPPA